MKYLLLIISFLLIAACGGGGSSKRQGDDNPTPTPYELPTYFTYELSDPEQSQKYQGFGVVDQSIVNFHPKSLSGSSYTVSARLIINTMNSNGDIGYEFSIYNFQSRAKIMEFNGSANRNVNQWVDHFENFTLTIQAPEFNNQRQIDLSLLNGQWLTPDYAGQFNEPVTTMEFLEGVVRGFDSIDCSVDGFVSITDQTVNSFNLELELSNCATPGDYKGSFHYDDGRIIGAVHSDDYGLTIDYRVE